MFNFKNLQPIFDLRHLELHMSLFKNILCKPRLFIGIMRQRNKFPFILIISIFASFHSASAQTYASSESLNWQIITNNQNTKHSPTYFLGFSGAIYLSKTTIAPYFNKTMEVAFNGKPSAEISGELFEAVSADSILSSLKGINIPEKITPVLTDGWGAEKHIVTLRFLPFRKNAQNGTIEKLISFNLKVTGTNNPVPHSASNNAARAKKGFSSSVLANGNWYRIGVTETGIYKMDYNFLTTLGIDKNASLKNLQLYGKPGGMLPMPNAAKRDEDLVENAIQVTDDNGSFDGNDYVLFYARGPVVWTYDGASNKFYHSNNNYCDTAYYYVTIGNNPGKRINPKASASGTADNDVTGFDAYDLHELDQVTDISTTVRSGSEWYGEDFKDLTGQVYITKSFNFNFPLIDLSSPAYLTTTVAARSAIQSQMTFAVNGITVATHDIPEAAVYDYEADFCIESYSHKPFTPTSTSLNVSATYTKTTNESEAWLNYIEVQTRGKLNYMDAVPQFSFRDSKTIAAGKINKYHIAGAAGNNAFHVWDVTDFHNIAEQQLNANGSEATFQAPADVLREYVAFTGAFKTPNKFGKVSNQDIHGSEQPDYVIVTHPNFMDAAKRLADLHRKRDNMVVNIFTPQQVFNEFSSGAQDPSAIRDMMKMYYNRYKKDNSIRQPKFLMLFGDVSYDAKNRLPNNIQYVTSFQSPNSTSVTLSYCADDYFGCLDSSEGNWSSGSDDQILDICIGRMPVTNITDANTVVDKLFRYEDSASMNDWRNRITFLADDQTGNLFFNQTESIANATWASYPVFNVHKIYFDAYKQISAASGNRYPDVNREINKTIEEGTLFLNYIGHGATVGWGHEQVLTLDMINGWKNKYKMPVIITATCEFSRFDDPIRVSAGQQCLFNPNGGAVALFSTTRLAYIQDNFVLSLAIHNNNILEKDANGKPQFLGEIMRKAKNVSHDNNCRNFSLLGDPAMRLAIPEYKTKINSITRVHGSSLHDTLKVLSLVTVKGMVTDNSGALMSNFNGKLYPTVYDKKSKQTTLANDPESANPDDFSSKANFLIQESIIYKGSATVENGLFSFSFVVPKDISYSGGFGKISLYADNNVVDAAGHDDSLVIGGTDKYQVNTNDGPKIRLFMNDTNFLNGGLVDPNPVLIAKLSSEVGINTTGNAVGHDISVSLNSGEPVIANNFYTADIDKFTSGMVNYPLYSLADGKYTLSLRAWDVANNTSDASIDFIVAGSSKLAIDKIFNYPNPLVDHTIFQFEHNRPNENLQVYISIFDMHGNLIKEIDQVINGPGDRVTSISWNARNDDGATVASGIYVYSITVKAQDGQTVQKGQKLVIIR